MLDMTGCLALDPQLISRPAPIRRLARLARFQPGISVHIGKHENLPCVNVLNYHGHESAAFFKINFDHQLISVSPNLHPYVQLSALRNDESLRSPLLAVRMPSSLGLYPPRTDREKSYERRKTDTYHSGLTWWLSPSIRLCSGLQPSLKMICGTGPQMSLCITFLIN